MRSKRQQKNFLMTILLLFTVFLYGCGGSAGVENTTMRFEMLDITTKAPVENVQIIVNGAEPNTETGQSTHIRRQLATDSRGIVTFSDLPPDRQYTVAASKDGYVLATNDGNDAPAWVPTLDNAGFYTEQGKTYTFTGYLRRSNSPTTGSVKGYVRDRLSNQPITTATVYITPAQQNENGAADVIDTTNKTSKPGYYELNDVPSGAQTLRIVAPGYQAVSVDGNFVIPAGGTIEYDVYLDTATGTINATIIAQDGDTFVGGYTFMAQVLRNGTEVVSDTVFTLADTADEGSPIKAFNLSFGDNATAGDNTFTGPGVPVLPSGSTDTYTIKITSDQAHMVNPANGLTGITMNVTPSAETGDGPTVNAGAIYMAVERGQISVTLYQIPYTTNPLNGQNDTTLREQAQQTSIVVVNGLGDTTSRYTGESPDRYFHYLVENMPVGRRSIMVNFPGHTLTEGDNTITGLLVLKDKTSGVTRSVNWITN